MEASHIVEILRDAGPSGLHVDEIARCVSDGNVYGGEGIIDSNKLSTCSPPAAHFSGLTSPQAIYFGYSPHIILARKFAPMCLRIIALAA